MPKNLLLADDSITIQKVVGITFAGEDYRVTTVDNGEDAIARAREMKPDVILADVVMPRKNGYEVCQAVKSDPALQHIPVLLLAGTFEAFDERRAESVRADGHIAKPFDSQALITRVKELTDAAAAPRPAPPAPSPAAGPSGAARAQPQAAGAPSALRSAPAPIPPGRIPLPAPPAGMRPAPFGGLPGAAPVGAMPPGVIPRPAMPPGVMPPGAVPRPGMPPGVRPMGPLPVGVRPTGAFPHGFVPPGVRPPMPPGFRPPPPGAPRPAGMTGTPATMPAGPVTSPGPGAFGPPVPALPIARAPVASPFPSRPAASAPPPAVAPPAHARAGSITAGAIPAAVDALAAADADALEPFEVDWSDVDLSDDDGAPELSSAVAPPAAAEAPPAPRVVSLDELDFGDVALPRDAAPQPEPASPPKLDLVLLEDAEAEEDLPELEPEELSPAAPAEMPFFETAIAAAAPAPALAPPPAPPVAAAPPPRPADGGEAALRAALSGASREIIERIAWEVVPQLAELLIREQIDRLVKERQR